MKNEDLIKFVTPIKKDEYKVTDLKNYFYNAFNKHAQLLDTRNKNNFNTNYYKELEQEIDTVIVDLPKEISN